MQAAKDLWDSYDLIATLILDFNDMIQIRINYLRSIDIDLLLGDVYMDAFEQFIKFLAVLTRYARDNKLGTY